ncbi:MULTISPECIES: hypothetical protein [Streptomyces]|uniref:Uncharacterized protein n=1 Tax=Streptomyces cacaoi TaxID=1898 RepID=A0A4Y3RA13_STRCI|nr:MULTISPECIES: hypothetical protein [Streptomyces]NNG87285.1 hypothetical protein [Streptomyces cacaoi]QHF96786.1 hypothetical protein DEH18_26355 [Streptomyces sp. NHF165]GEB53678.1 hypothetical protein SCA03_62290 [Streptomyces cacaoi]
MATPTATSAAPSRAARPAHAAAADSSRPAYAPGARRSHRAALRPTDEERRLATEALQRAFDRR